MAVWTTSENEADNNPERNKEIHVQTMLIVSNGE
jgi:hypothetical protein